MPLPGRLQGGDALENRNSGDSAQGWLALWRTLHTAPGLRGRAPKIFIDQTGHGDRFPSVATVGGFEDDRGGHPKGRLPRGGTDPVQLSSRGLTSAGGGDGGRRGCLAGGGTFSAPPAFFRAARPARPLIFQPAQGGG